MKLDALVYAIVVRVFHELEHAHHYVVPDDIKKQVIASLQDRVDDLIP